MEQTITIIPVAKPQRFRQTITDGNLLLTLRAETENSFSIGVIEVDFMPVFAKGKPGFAAFVGALADAPEVLGRRRRQGAGGGEQGRAVPEAEMAEDFFRNGALVNHRDDAHGVLALGADERVGVPHFEDEVTPLLGRELGGWRWNAGRAQGSGGRCATKACSAITPAREKCEV